MTSTESYRKIGKNQALDHNSNFSLDLKLIFNREKKSAHA